jgi:dihydropteroate synthase
MGSTPSSTAGDLRVWRHAGGVIALDRCLVMAVVNVTPDSFHDGGRWIAQSRRKPNASVVIAQCRRWVEQGADLLDVGGESTRPGAEPVDEELELARVLPVIEGLRADPKLAEVPISVDTRHAGVARAALAAGATIVNDISGLADPEMAGVVAETGAGLILGHLRGEPATMQDHIEFTDLLGEVGDELAATLARAEAAGVAREQVLVDPGIGFGKTVAQSTALVGASELLTRRTGRPVLIGASRKRFLGELSGKPVGERMLASVVAAVVAAAHGAAVVRVHDVVETVEALRVQAAIEAELARVAGGAGR